MVIKMFQPVVPEANLHPDFRTLSTLPGYAPARAIMQKVFEAFRDKDGNFLEQFQTTGFNARTWELFLFAWLTDATVEIDWNHSSPDFCCRHKGIDFFIEAVTANKSPAEETSGEFTVEERQEQHRPIRLGSALYSKLQMRYWELPHVSEKPLIFAIEDFHAPDSLAFTSSSLWQYLYGIRGSWWIDGSGVLHVDERPVEHHRRGTKVIPSGFFNQAGAENISAVIFGNSGTIAKFNRMGWVLGTARPDNVKMVRIGTCYDHSPNSPTPLVFQYGLDDPDAPIETWSQGLEIFHNPHATAPLPLTLLSIAYHYHDGVMLRSYLPDFHPYGSRTVIIQTRTVHGKHEREWSMNLQTNT
jgi:hypothetical protein